MSITELCICTIELSPQVPSIDHLLVLRLSTAVLKELFKQKSQLEFVSTFRHILLISVLPVFDSMTDQFDAANSIHSKEIC